MILTTSIPHFKTVFLTITVCKFASALQESIIRLVNLISTLLLATPVLPIMSHDDKF
jgi:hypothetical protein